MLISSHCIVVPMVTSAYSLCFKLRLSDSIFVFFFFSFGLFLFIVLGWIVSLVLDQESLDLNLNLDFWCDRQVLTRCPIIHLQYRVFFNYQNSRV